jgi:lysophospholipase L1-like esterase
MSVVLPRLARAIRRRMFSTVPRLPEATGDRGRTAVGAEPALRLTVLGDSSAAGVGAATHDEAVAGQLSAALAGLTGRAVSWRVVAEIGATTARVGATLTRDLAVPVEGWRPDVVVVMVGTNDLLRWRAVPAWRADLAELFTQVRHRAPDALVVVSGLPPLDRFPLVPNLLRPATGHRLRRMEQVLAAASTRAGYLYVPLPRDGAERWYAPDGFHPAPAASAARVAPLQAGPQQYVTTGTAGSSSASARSAISIRGRCTAPGIRPCRQAASPRESTSTNVPDRSSACTSDTSV